MVLVLWARTFETGYTLCGHLQNCLKHHPLPPAAFHKLQSPHAWQFFPRVKLQFEEFDSFFMYPLPVGVMCEYLTIKLWIFMDFTGKKELFSAPRAPPVPTWFPQEILQVSCTNLLLGHSWGWSPMSHPRRSRRLYGDQQKPIQQGRGPLQQKMQYSTLSLSKLLSWKSICESIRCLFVWKKLLFEPNSPCWQGSFWQVRTCSLSSPQSVSSTSSIPLKYMYRIKMRMPGDKN